MVYHYRCGRKEGLLPINAPDMSEEEEKKGLLTPLKQSVWANTAQQHPFWTINLLVGRCRSAITIQSPLTLYF